MSRILLIEDETSTQNLLQSRLQDLGYDVAVESTGARGLFSARQERFDLFLVDVGLGSGIDGLEVCRRLKAMPQLHSTPVVLISGQVKSQEELHRGYEAGCESFLVKGDLTLMEDVVRAMLRIRSLQNDLGLQNRLLEEQNRRLQEERRRGEDLESALRESGSRALVFRELAAGRPDGIVIVDGEGICRFVDRGARDIGGRDLEGKTIGSLAPGSGLEAFVRDARTEPREGYRFDTGLRQLTATVVPLVPRASRNERSYKVVMLTDATRRRVAAEMLRMEEHGTPRRELGPLLEAARRAFHPSAFPGDCAAVRELRARTTRLAMSDVPVLITGEVGSGQDWIARSLHFAGPRSGAFIPINCAAQAPAMLDAELFGQLKGDGPEPKLDRPGLLHQADHGTLLLASVEALPPALQGKLLGFLESGEAYRLGSTTPEHLDVRVVASTSVDLKSLSEDGDFLPELYWRLASAELRTPPLRERGEDVLLLARLFLQRHATENPALRFADDVLWLFTRYPWPGNVRELENCVESACSMAKGDRIAVPDLSPPLVDLYRELEAEGDVPHVLGLGPGFSTVREGPSAAGSSYAEIPLSLDSYERLCLERALRETGGDKRKSARLLNMGKSTFYRKLKLHDIDWPPRAGAHSR